MKRFWVMILVFGLLLTGCGDKETVTTTEPAPIPPAKPTATEQVKKTADDVAKKATEMVETGTQIVKDTAADATQAVKEVVATAKEDVTAVAEVAKQKTTAMVDSSKQKGLEVKEQLAQEGTQVLNALQKNPADSKTATEAPAPTKETPTVEAKSSNLVASAAAVVSSVTSPSKAATEEPPEILIIKNKNGNVTLTHAEHGKNYGCESCHGDAVPGPFELGKDTAHAMCKNCHKEQGGPTKCSGCHKK